jgi:uncharacterized protein YqeY
MKIQIIIDADIDSGELNARSPLMRILRMCAKDKDSQFSWYEANREKILAQEKEKRALYAREQYLKRKDKKEEVKNVVVMPEFPADNVLRFP